MLAETGRASRPVALEDAMAKSPALALHTCLFLIFFGLAIAGCGGSTMNSSRQMQGLTVTPASADAQASPGGQVQYGADHCDVAARAVEHRQPVWLATREHARGQRGRQWPGAMQRLRRQ